MSITGRPGEGPLRAGIAIGDSSAGIYLAFGIVTALLEREETGEGQWVSTSLLQALIAMLDFQAARWVVSHEVPEQVGNDHPLYMPTGAFRTADGYINIAERLLANDLAGSLNALAYTSVAYQLVTAATTCDGSFSYGTMPKSNSADFGADGNYKICVKLADGAIYSLTFYDPVRLQQTLEDDTRTGRAYFTEPGLVIIPEITTAMVRQAIQGLWREGFFHNLKRQS